MLLTKKAFTLIFLLMAFGFYTGNAHAGEPTKQLKSDIDQVIKLLNDQTLDKDQKDQEIIDSIRHRFDFPTMSQWILALNWRKATPEQRARFIDLFTQLLENTYKGRVQAYTGTYSQNNVKYIDEQIKRGRALVKTLIVTESNEIPVDYKLSENQGGWQVYDVVIEEVSLVRNYRSTYGEIVDREGFDGLFKRMQDKIEEVKSRPEPGPSK